MQEIDQLVRKTVPRRHRLLLRLSRCLRGGQVRPQALASATQRVGVYHEGKQEPLVSTELWLRVQDVLTAHNIAGDKEFKHHHYLKGSIFCGECGARLVFTRNRGRGCVYEYFDCLSKKTKRKPCARRMIRIEKVEDAIVAFYSRFRISQERIELIRSGVLDELAADREDAVREEQRARRAAPAVEGSASQAA